MRSTSKAQQQRLFRKVSYADLEVLSLIWENAPKGHSP